MNKTNYEQKPYSRDTIHSRFLRFSFRIIQVMQISILGFYPHIFFRNRKQQPLKTSLFVAELDNPFSCCGVAARSLQYSNYFHALTLLRQLKYWFLIRNHIQLFFTENIRISKYNTSLKISPLIRDGQCN